MRSRKVSPAAIMPTASRQAIPPRTRKPTGSGLSALSTSAAAAARRDPASGEIAERLNAATGPTALVLPLRGVSALDAPGQPFHDPAADAALFDTLRHHLRDDIPLVQVDAHINDAAFADALVRTFGDISRAQD